MDRPGKQNTVANFLSRIQNTNEDSPVEDKFPDEYLFAVTTKTPWYADIANYLVTGKLPPQKKSYTFGDTLQVLNPR